MLAALAPGAIWVQMSTIGVAGIERVEALVEAERPDVILVDAPVSGSKEPAEQGQLTIFASGPEVARSRLDPLFDALGQRTIWVGPVGAGSRLKLVANVLARPWRRRRSTLRWPWPVRLGLETETVVNALDGSPLVSPWQAAKLQRIAQGDFSAQFALSLALKDVHLALEAAGDDRFQALAAPGGRMARGRRPRARRPAISRSSPGHSKNTEGSPRPDRTCNLGSAQSERRESQSARTSRSTHSTRSWARVLDRSPSNRLTRAPRRSSAT